MRGAFALWEIGAGGRTEAVQRNSPVGCFDRRRPNGGYAPVRIDPINHFISVRGAFALWEIGSGGRTAAVLFPQISKEFLLFFALHFRMSFFIIKVSESQITCIYGEGSYEKAIAVFTFCRVFTDVFGFRRTDGDGCCQQPVCTRTGAGIRQHRGPLRSCRQPDPCTGSHPARTLSRRRGGSQSRGGKGAV